MTVWMDLRFIGHQFLYRTFRELESQVKDQ